MSAFDLDYQAQITDLGKDSERSRKSSQVREKALKAGNYHAKGYLGPLSPKTAVQIGLERKKLRREI